MNSTTMATGFTGRIPAVDVPDQLALFAGHLFQNFQARAKSQVADFPAPHALHHPQIQRLENEDIVPVGQFMDQLEKPVLPFVGNALVKPCQRYPCLFAAIGVLLMTGKLLV